MRATILAGILLLAAPLAHAQSDLQPVIAEGVVPDQPTKAQD